MGPCVCLSLVPILVYVLLNQAQLVFVLFFMVLSCAVFLPWEEGKPREDKQDGLSPLPMGATKGQTTPYDSSISEISRFEQNPLLGLANTFHLGEFIASVITCKVYLCPMKL